MIYLVELAGASGIVISPLDNALAPLLKTVCIVPALGIAQ